MSGYYGKPIVRPHIWKDSIAWYFFTGGLAGASSVIAAAAELTDRPEIARHARRAAIIGLVPSPVLLIHDLGRRSKFYNMLRVFKPSSPMSVGSWLLTAYSPAAGGALVLQELGRLPRLARALGLAAGVVGPTIATYTAVLVADTATPAWHEARHELPVVFAGSALASGAAATTTLAALADSPTTLTARAGALGAVVEIATSKVMQQRLGELDVYSSDPATKRFDRAATVLSLGGALGSLLSRGRRVPTLLSSAALLAGSVCTRFAVTHAGTASASDPESVLIAQAS